MNKIDILDLDVVEQDIIDFYEDEGKSISRSYLRELLDIWSINKYSLYEKMGYRLIVSSDDVASEDLRFETSFKTVVRELADRHESKSEGDPNDFQTICKNILYSLSSEVDFTPGVILNIVNNKGLMKNSQILRFVYSLMPIIIESSNKEIETKKWSNQVKLTKQISAVIKDLSTEKVIYQSFEMKKDWFETFEKAMLTVLSEIKQSLSRSSESPEFFMSIHPYDFVTASYNQQGWSSCYAPDNSFSKSVFTLMTDDGTAISYVPSRKELSGGYRVELNSKKMRAFVHFDQELNHAVVSKVYPTSYSSYPGAVARLLHNTKVIENARLEVVKPGELDVWSSECMYADLNCVSSYDKIVDPAVSKISAVGIGRDTACMSCGDMNSLEYDSDDGFSSWSCNFCRYGDDYFVCPRCEETRAGDERSHGENSHCDYCEDELDDFYSPEYEYCECGACQERKQRYYEELKESRKERCFRTAQRALNAKVSSLRKNPGRFQLQLRREGFKKSFIEKSAIQFNPKCLTIKDSYLEYMFTTKAFNS